MSECMYNIGFAISVMTADPPAKAYAICGFFISPLGGGAPRNADNSSLTRKSSRDYQEVY